MDKSPAIRILIAGNQGIFCDGLRKLLDAEPGLRVIGEAAEGGEALKAARLLKPDILLLDVALLRPPSLEALRELESLSTPVRAILLVSSIEKDELIEVLQVGVRGIILKESATQLLIKGIRNVMVGQYWLGRESVSDLVGALRERQPTNGRGREKNFGLTRRELEIVGTIAAGYMNKDIAQKFSLSEQTVKHHLTKIFAKLGVCNRLELALFAVDHELMEQSSDEKPPQPYSARTGNALEQPRGTAGLSRDRKTPLRNEAGRTP